MSLQLRSLVDFCAVGPGGTVTVAITGSGLTPLVVMAALRRAGTAVYEPLNRFRLDVPADSFSSLAPVLARLRAVLHMQELHGSS